ncbi:MAG TPA: hypothetical protein VKZ63_15420, partial [Kofleriaceae bacterium]|nr:hypothetical protein [Kofleriaceae bacterium]
IAAAAITATAAAILARARRGVGRIAAALIPAAPRTTTGRDQKDDADEMECQASHGPFLAQGRPAL